MRNKIFLFKLCYCFFLIFFSNLVLSDEFKFTASEVEFYDNGNLIKGSNGIKINDNSGLVIISNEFEYDKAKSILKILGDVSIEDKINKNTIKTNEAIFYKKRNILISKGATNIALNSNHIIKSSNITFDRNQKKIFSIGKTLITDVDNNRFSMNEFSFLTIEKILTAKKIKIIDNQSNSYEFEQIKYNLKTNEILGKDLLMNFSNKNFNSNQNEPRLKGNALIYKNNTTTVNKGIFTTCKKNDDCPPWTLTSKEIKHDKIKKTISYKNAWLKIYDTPVFYFPKFFHPDPTVKRQSGFLVPKFAQSSTLGNYISTPYFNVISDSADLTFSPRIYDNGNSVYQSEYRNFNKNSKHVADFSIRNKSALIVNEKKKSSSSHFFLKSEFDLDLSFFDEAKIDLKLQETSNDDYLKTYKIKSPLIESENNLHTSLNFKASKDDLEIDIITEKYENLNLINSDRYEYIYPSFNISKILKEYNIGNLSLVSNGHNKLFNTNVSEKTIVNDIKFKANDKISLLGLVSSYEILLKNFNAKSNNSTTYKNKTQNELQSIVNYEIKYPLQKTRENFISIMTPILSVRYSPNESKDKSLEDRMMYYNNIFSLNRIGENDTVEGGQSITIGNEYAIYDKFNIDKKIFSVNLATVLRDIENHKLPKKSTIGKKNSDVFGDINFKTNKLVDLNYNFSLDSDLDTMNYHQIKSTFKINNFISTFDFLEKNNVLGNESYISNSTTYDINENNSFGFKTRKNKEKGLTEYYNLIYQYKNDCLVAGVEYKKDFYSDGSMKPEEQLFFSITILPFGKINSPDVKQ